MTLYLYIDDEAPNRMAAEFEMKLARSQFPGETLLMAAHFQQGVEAVEKSLAAGTPVDGIVLDLRFPGAPGGDIGGIGFLKYLRNHPNKIVAATPVVLYSGDLLEDIQAELQAAKLPFPHPPIVFKPGNFLDMIATLRPAHGAARPVEAMTADGVSHNRYH